MKKSIFFAILLCFIGLFFWEISFFNFSKFHFYGLIDEIFLATQTEPSVYLKKYLPSLLFLGVYIISLTYLALLCTKKIYPFLGLILAELLLYFLLPKISFIFIGLAFALGSFMLILQIAEHQKTSLKFNFFDLSYKAINQFIRYTLIVLCLYNFILIKNEPFVIPTSALNTIVEQMENSLFSNSIPSDEILKNTEINLTEIINSKTQEFLKPYQTYLPYILTSIFFSTLYFLLTFIIFIYAFLAVIIHTLLLKIGFIKIDLREVAQEYLV
jgi:hypothetical protein